MMTDRRRVECALIPRLLYAVAADTTFSCFDEQGNVVDPEGFATLERMRGLLKVACSEPMDGLPPDKAASLKRRVERTFRDVIGDLDDQPAVKVALAIIYALQNLLDDGSLVLIEGSTTDEAITLLLPMAEHGLEMGAINKSAQKQSARLLERARRLGFFPAHERAE